jgi:hypothetical protein
MNLPLLAAIDANHLQTHIAPLLLILIPVIIALAIWDGVWKLIALWKSARNDQLPWFICLAIFNTAGILPILYILFFQKKPAPPVPTGI